MKKNIIEDNNENLEQEDIFLNDIQDVIEQNLNTMILDANFVGNSEFPYINLVRCVAHTIQLKKINKIKINFN